MSTGRSDYPNQVNNALVFPYIFRGLMDVQAKRLTTNIQKACVEALASLGRSLSDDQGNPTFDAEHLLPNALDTKLLTTLATAVAHAAIKEGVAQKEIKNWQEYTSSLVKWLV